MEEQSAKQKADLRFPAEMCKRYNCDSAKLIGKGTYGKVFCVMHKRTLERRACKRISKRHCDAEALEREVNILSLLQHPHIVRFYETFEDECFVYIITEYCGDGELHDYVSTRQFLDEVEARALALQLLSALEYLHGNLLAHRDFKLENVWLKGHVKGTPLPSLRLGDFGFSKFVKPSERSRTFCGSPMFTAPEIICHSTYEPLQADLWSFGVVLSAMVLGHYPFRATADRQIIAEAVQHGSPRLLHLRRRVDGQDASAEFESLLRQLLRKDPQERLRLDRIKQSAWFANAAPLPNYLPLRQPRDEISRTLVQNVVSLGFSSDEVWRGVIDNDCSKLCVAMYHLLAERLEGSTGLESKTSRTLSSQELPQRVKQCHSSSDLMMQPATPPFLVRKLRRSKRSIEA